jgi:hypothetical protein
MPRGRPKKVVSEKAQNKIFTTQGTVERNDQTNNQLVDIIQNLASNVQKLTQKVAELEKKNEYTSDNVLKIGGEQTTTNYSNNADWQMPSNYLQTAKRILGEKFAFRCESSPDQPQFIFTVIVPTEYSAIKDVPDERSKTIPNALGVNGVEEWCNLVKQNIIKSLGNNVLQTL